MTALIAYNVLQIAEGGLSKLHLSISTIVYTKIQMFFTEGELKCVPCTADVLICRLTLRVSSLLSLNCTNPRQLVILQQAFGGGRREDGFQLSLERQLKIDSRPATAGRQRHSGMTISCRIAKELPAEDLFEVFV